MTTASTTAPAYPPCPNCGGALTLVAGRIVGGRPRLRCQQCGNVYMSLRKPDMRAKGGAS